MNKPLSVAKEEFTRGMVSLVNNSGLPPCLVEEILNGVLLEVKNLARKQYEKDLQAWEQSQNSESEVVE